MPSGVYPHTSKKQRQAALRNFEKGRRDPKARKKALIGLRRNGSRPEFREKMREIALRLIKDPTILKKRIAGFQKYYKQHGPNYKGGNGQEPISFIKQAEAVLAPQGFERELVIKTKDHRTEHNPPPNYKVDFGDPLSKIAIEFDSPLHRRLEEQEKDRRKNEVLESLGWTVYRITHQ